MTKLIAMMAGGMLIGITYAARAADSPDAMNKAAAKVAVELCSACHGPGGNSTSPTFPKLDGQQKMYLMGQIRAFKSKSRSDPEAHDYMWGMAATVDDSLVEGLADYFSSQPPPAGRPGDPKLIAQGEKLFHNGDPARKIAACAGCHGAHAEGQTIFPRLAGQHAAYIVRQLQVIQKNLRNSPIMHGIVPDLTPADMQAVAQYLQSL